jgi:hypothetical protein
MGPSSIELGWRRHSIVTTPRLPLPAIGSGAVAVRRGAGGDVGTRIEQLPDRNHSQEEIMKGRVYGLGAVAVGLALCVSGAARAQSSSAGADQESGQSAQDAKLEKKIDQRLQHDARLKKDNLDASVSKGTVTLTGQVNSTAEKDRAERLARTKGVSDVDNQIEVRSASESSAGQGGGASEQPSANPSPSEQQPQQAQPEEQGAQGAQGQQGQQQAPKIEEKSTKVEERTETHVERKPSGSSESQGNPSGSSESQGASKPSPNAPSDESAAPRAPQKPTPPAEPMPPK